MPSLGLGLGLNRNQGIVLDPDALAWAQAVVSAGSSVPFAVVNAVSNFIKSCKADPSPNVGVSNWDAMKSVQLLAGPDTFAGLAVPLKGPAPTFFNFVGADYDPADGLAGDGSTKYINSNYSNSADPQNNQSLWVYATTIGTGGFIGAGASTTGTSYLTAASSRSQSATAFARTVTLPGTVGVSRSESGSYNSFYDGADHTVTQDSETPLGANVYVFATRANAGTAATNISNHGIAAYGIGEAVGLTALDSRLTTLMAVIAAAHQ